MTRVGPNTTLERCWALGLSQLPDEFSAIQIKALSFSLVSHI